MFRLYILEGLHCKTLIYCVFILLRIQWRTIEISKVVMGGGGARPQFEVQNGDNQNITF